MDIKTFTDNALRTESHIDAIKADPMELGATVELVIAAGRLLDLVKKNVFYGKPIDGTKRRDAIDMAYDAIDTLSDGKTVSKMEFEVNPRVFHAIVGMATEVTELVEALHKHMQDGDPLDTVNVSEELGDYDWYKAILLDALQINEGQSRERVIAKLRARYPGKFDADKAINRDTGTERQILEGKASVESIAQALAPSLKRLADQ